MMRGKTTHVKRSTQIQRLWVNIWLFRFWLCVNPFPQTPQINGFSPVCTRACLTTSDDWIALNGVAGQYPQKNKETLDPARQPRQTPGRHDITVCGKDKIKWWMVMANHHWKTNSTSGQQTKSVIFVSHSYASSRADMQFQTTYSTYLHVGCNESSLWHRSREPYKLSLKITCIFWNASTKSFIWQFIDN